MKFQGTITGKANVDSFIAGIMGVQSAVKLWANSSAPSDIMSESFQQNFSQQGRPKKWAALAPKTVGLREHKGFPGSRPILVMTGDFRDGITGMKGKVSTMMGGVGISWGEAQLSSENKVKLKAHETGVSSEGKNMPKRNVLLIQSRDADNLASSLNKFIMSQLQ